MSFPTTPVLDSFDRADEGPPPSANWTNSGFGPNTLQVVSNLVRGVGGGGDAFWNVQKFGPDCEAFITTLSTAVNWNVWVRRPDPLVGPPHSGYRLRSSPTGYTFLRLDAGVTTQLGAAMVNAVAGDTFGLSAVGDQLTATMIRSGVGSQLGVRTDSTYMSAGWIGMYVNGAGADADDFGGGTIPRRFTNTLGIRSPVRYDVR